jgi:hypothetical protein
MHQIDYTGPVIKWRAVLLWTLPMNTAPLLIVSTGDGQSDINWTEMVGKQAIVILEFFIFQILKLTPNVSSPSSLHYRTKENYYFKPQRHNLRAMPNSQTFVISVLY